MIPNDPRIQLATEQFNLFEFLDEFGVQYSLSGRNIGTGFVGVYNCPSCGKPDNHFGIHKTGKFGSCFVCKAYLSLTSLIMIYGHMRYKEAIAYLLESLTESTDIVDQVKFILHGKEKQRDDVVVGTDKLPSSRLINIKDLINNKYIHDFFIKRKLNLWHVSFYGLRIGLEGDSKNKIIFPITLKGRVVTYQHRSLFEKQYKNSSNMGNYIIDEDRIIPHIPLILVEGYLDFTRIDSFIRCFYKNRFSVTSGCLKGISSKQIQRIINNKPSKIITMFDHDSWFDYERIQREIPIDVQYQMLPKDKDPNDLTWKELKNLFKELESHT